MMNWLLHTGCVLGKTDRGVLGRGNSIMEFRDSSKEFFVNGLISSQGTPQTTIRVGSKLVQGQGWLKLTQNQELEVRRKRHKTESSSIQLFYNYFGTIKGLTASALVCVMLLSPRFAQAGELGLSLTPPAKPDPVEAVGDQFEGMMLQLLYNQMLQANQIVKPGDDNPFAPSNGEMIFRSMQQDGMMQQLAQRRPLGIGSLVARQLRGQTGVGTRILLDSDRQTKSDLKQGSSENGHH